MDCIEHELIDFIRDFKSSPLIFNSIFGLIEQRGRVGSRGSIIFEIRTKEQGHNVPHVHAHYGSDNISISLIDFSVLAGNIPKKQEKVAVEWVKKNINNLKDRWNEYHRYTIPVI